MQIARSSEVLPLDSEIERTCRRLRQQRRQQQARTMAEEPNIPQENPQQARALRDYFKPIVNKNYSGIRRQTINANNFELKPALINMVEQNQYGG